MHGNRVLNSSNVDRLLGRLGEHSSVLSTLLLVEFIRENKLESVSIWLSSINGRPNTGPEGPKEVLSVPVHLAFDSMRMDQVAVWRCGVFLVF